jgi:hypothetical protein
MIVQLTFVMRLTAFSLELDDNSIIEVKDKVTFDLSQKIWRLKQCM